MAFMPLRLVEKRDLTPQITEFVLTQADGTALAAATPGSHINVRTPSGAIRSYSLTNCEGANDCYVIAVKREENGRGGSLSMHRDLVAGDTVAASQPIQNFPLLPAKRYLLLAGGIGITPILSMARSLVACGHSNFSLVYLTRSAETTAYLNDLAALGLGPRCIVHHDLGNPADGYDLWPHLSVPEEMHIYCCGPAPLMAAVHGMTIHWPSSHIHFEDFSGVRAVENDARPFRVRRSSTGEVYDIPADKSIVRVLRERGLDIETSCESGTCGTCVTRLISGTPLDRDLVLAPEERGTLFVPCVSRAREGEELVLDF
jgi:phthalate 4,5-dioxygenase reductase subunit